MVDYTPGPWLIHATNRVIVQANGALNDITVKDGAVVGDDLPVSICLLRNPDEQFSEDETLANGFLIAAAPELLEALERLQAVLHAGILNSNGTDVDAALKAMVAAIAKARGEAA